MINVEQLRSTVTSEQALTEILSIMSGIGFATTSWQTGSLGLAFATFAAELYVKLKNELVVTTINLVYNDTASGVPLSFLSDALFDNQRIIGVATQGTMTLTDDSGGGPHTITAGAYTFTESVSGIVYRNTTGGTLAMSSTLDITIEAEDVGIDGNVSNATITQMSPTIAGVSASNGVAGGSSWITRLGTNAEADAVLRTRNRTKWATLSPNSPSSAYEYLVLNSTDGAGDPVGISKVWVDASNPGGPGTVYIYVANQTATATGTQVTDIQTYVDDNRVSPAAIPTVIAATEVEIDVYGALFVDRGFGEAARLEAIRVVSEYIDGTDDGTDIGLRLGGDQLDSQPGGAGFVLFSEIVKKIRDIDTIQNVQMSSPTSDVALAGNELATVGTVSFTVSEI